MSRTISWHSRWNCRINVDNRHVSWKVEGLLIANMYRGIVDKWQKNSMFAQNNRILTKIFVNIVDLHKCIKIR